MGMRKEQREVQSKFYVLEIIIVEFGRVKFRIESP